jgi:FkbM family methyltransferase
VSDFMYQIDKDISIKLPNNHLLPSFQSSYPLYDRFLPVVAEKLPARTTVIDVGANCGDSLAAMFAANKLLNFVCIEPDDAFYKYLSDNIELLRLKHPSASIQSIKSLVGKSIKNAELVVGDNVSTRRMAPVQAGGGGIKSQTLDDIINPDATVSLIKSDVDGYDYDVLESAETLIITHHPLLYFEYRAQCDQQSYGYHKVVNWLTSVGYNDFVMFDNYGGMMMRTDDPDSIYQLSSYIQLQNNNVSTRTIHYLDVLCGSERNKEVVSSILDAYSETCSRKTNLGN